MLVDIKINRIFIKRNMDELYYLLKKKKPRFNHFYLDIFVSKTQLIIQITPFVIFIWYHIELFQLFNFRLHANTSIISKFGRYLSKKGNKNVI